MTYRETLEYLFSALPMFQRIGQAAYKADLNNTLALDNYFEHPHKKFKTIHIAGTNGKGSVSHMLSAILQKAGYRTGLYTSPHLKDFRERMKINGKMIPEKEVVHFVKEHKLILDELQPSFFEMTVAMAFHYFASQETDIAVIETGMGGRLDSTNIITPLISVITNIGLDHTQFLGDTLVKIAGEKAGIIKPHIPVVIGEWDKETYPVFQKAAEKNNARLSCAEHHYKTSYSTVSAERHHILSIHNLITGKNINIITDLMGNYQQKNIPCVLHAIDSLRSEGLKIPKDAVAEGIKKVKELTGLQGRWEEIGYNPLIVCDTTHNREGFLVTVEQIRNTPWKKLHFVLGLVKDKDLSSILPILPPEAYYYFTKANIPRAMNHNDLKYEAGKAGLTGDSYSSVKKAVTAARKLAGKDDMIFIGGSTFVVAEALP